ncbi:MAG: hypothetical protein ICV53_05145, partial [Flavisolibacter sp.]|nr:hypothetical protein [Flavisolibacter sp.]
MPLRKPTLSKARGMSRLPVAAVCTVMLFSTLLLLQSCQKLQDFFPKDKPSDKVLDLALIADGLTSPIGVVTAPDNSKRLFVIDQIGKIWIINKYGARLSTPFLDV